MLNFPKFCSDMNGVKKMSKKNRFYKISDQRGKREQRILTQLVSEISKKHRISTNLLEKCCEKTLDSWEQEENLPTTTIYMMRWEDRAYQIESIVDSFKDNMRSILSSEKKIEQSTDIASDAFKMIYYV